MSFVIESKTSALLFRRQDQKVSNA